MKKLALILTVLLTGCVGYFTVPSKEALTRPAPPLPANVQTTLVRSGFSREAVEKGGIAVFAVKKRGGPAGFRQNMAFELFQALRAYFPKARVVPRADLIRRAREDGRFSEWTAFIADYEDRGVMDPVRLRAWGRRVGVRYLFIGQIRSNDKHTATRTMLAGEDGVARKVNVFESGPVHLPYEVHKTVSLAGEIWDAECGKAVWTGTSGSEITEPSERERVRVEDIFIFVTRELIGELNRVMKQNRGGVPAAC